MILELLAGFLADRFCIQTLQVQINCIAPLKINVTKKSKFSDASIVKIVLDDLSYEN